MIKKVRVGDVVKIKYKENMNIEGINTILITGKVKNRLLAVWYEGDEYDGKKYFISPNQKIFEIVQRNVKNKEN